MNETRATPPDVLTMIGRRKLNLPENYKHCGWEVLEPGLLVYMREFYTKTRGKNKGKTGWRNKRMKVYISDAEMQEEQLVWEAATGKCSTCGGDGQQWTGWNHITGNSFKTCTRCNGTGEKI